MERNNYSMSSTLPSFLLVNDSGSGTRPATLGKDETVENSQCEVTTKGASVDRQGDELSVKIPIHFKPAFADTKKLILYAENVTGEPDIVAPAQIRGSSRESTVHGVLPVEGAVPNRSLQNSPGSLLQYLEPLNTILKNRAHSFAQGRAPFSRVQVRNCRLRVRRNDGNIRAILFG